MVGFEFQKDFSGPSVEDRLEKDKGEKQGVYSHVEKLRTRTKHRS